MTGLALRIEKFAVYIIIIYMATMTGLYFHMDSRINVLQTLQNKTFEKFAIKEAGHDASLAAIRDEFQDLSVSVKDLNKDVKNHLNSLTNLLIHNSTLIRENNTGINELTDENSLLGEPGIKLYKVPTIKNNSTKKINR